MQSKINQKPIVKYYVGESGFKSVCQRSLDYAEGEILFLTDMMEWYKVYSIDYDNNHYIPTRLKRNIFLKLLAFKVPRTERMKEKDSELLRETRFLTDNNKFKSTIMIYGEEVAITISSEPYAAIVIENKDVHDSFKAIFNDLWEKSIN